MEKTYYTSCAFPKSKDVRKKKPQNGYKEKPFRVCEVCGEYGAERHEIFGGPNRLNSIEDKLQMDLCADHHRMWHEDTSDEVERWKLQRRQQAQRTYEEKLIGAGKEPQQARLAFLRRYGKSYL